MHMRGLGLALCIVGFMASAHTHLKVLHGPLLVGPPGGNELLRRVCLNHLHNGRWRRGD